MMRAVRGHKKSVGEVNNLPSLTVPDQALTIEELLLNFTRGVAFQQDKIAIYNEDFDMNIKGLDLVELEMLKEELKERQREGNERLREIERLKKQKINSEKIDNATKNKSEENS